MRLVTLNLATRPFRNNKVVGTTLAVAAVALATATGFNLFVFFNYGSAYAQLQRDQQADREKLAAFQQQEGILRGEIKTRDFKRVYERGSFAHELILKQAFSWTLLFNKLEGVVPPDVMMTAIRPNVTSDGIVVRIEGVAKNHGALIAFEDRLLGHPSFSRVFPSTEKRINPNRTELSFILGFDYLPRTSAEVVASAAPPAGPKGDEAGATEAAAEPKAVVETTAGTPPASAPSIAAPGAPKRSAAGASAGLPAGRDGQPRPAALLTRRVVAPGGFYDPVGAAAAATRPADGADRVMRKPSPAGSAPPAATGTPAGASGRAAARPDPPREPVPEDGPGDGLQPPRDGAARGGRGAAASRTATPAHRLDVDLNFVSRPIGDVYGVLERAHGVRFEIDSGVDHDRRISANLSGRSLGDALALVAGAARHRVTLTGQGVYRVADGSGGASLREGAVEEENLEPAAGPRP